MNGPDALWPQGGGSATYPPSMPHRVRIEQPTETRTITGARNAPGWSLFRDEVPANVEDLVGRALFAAQTAGKNVSTRIVIPWLEGLNETMRVLHDGVIYGIVSALPDRSRRQHITLMCESGANRG